MEERIVSSERERSMRQKQAEQEQRLAKVHVHYMCISVYSGTPLIRTPR